MYAYKHKEKLGILCLIIGTIIIKGHREQGGYLHKTKHLLVNI